MKRFFIILLLGIVLLGLSWLFMQQSSPFNKEKLDALIIENEIEKNDWNALQQIIVEYKQDGKIFELLSANAYIFFVMLSSSSLLLFTALHLFVDKLFFKEYYESPSLRVAVRRSCVLVVALSSAFVIWIYSLNNLYILAIAALATGAEVLVWRFGKTSY